MCKQFLCKHQHRNNFEKLYRINTEEIAARAVSSGYRNIVFLGLSSFRDNYYFMEKLSIQNRYPI